ncbi:hypothetical protein PENNAL_c0040G07323 [Penicillium nalgiovense]|uniref:Uncharacterized protein n=1 Tax=Penicillium nalgiovense TaxID=60175 RepID=A0A1V6Y2E2_PENNA|nr:hypothetical protein PENNAL_c0040G07323 [Penicillium nalgiovense]
MNFNEFVRGFDEPMGYDIQGDNELRQWKPSSSLDSNSALRALLFTAEDCDFHFAREGIELVSISVFSNTDPTTLDDLLCRPFGSIDSALLGPQSLPILQETSCQ